MDKIIGRNQIDILTW